MKTMSAIEAKTRFGRLLKATQGGPVTVTRAGRPAAVMLSVEEFERLRGIARQRFLTSLNQTQSEAEAAGLTAETLDPLLADEG